MWIKKAEMVDSRESVRDIKFAPHHMGLKLVGTMPNYKLVLFHDCISAYLLLLLPYLRLLVQLMVISAFTRQWTL